MRLIICYLTFVLLIAISCALPQNVKDDQPNNFFNKNDNYKACGKEKVCVPHFLCQNEQVVTDGTDLIDTRSAGTKDNKMDESRKKRQISVPETETDCGLIEQCCKLPEKRMDSVAVLATTDSSDPIITSTSSADNIGCGHRNPDGTGFRIANDDNNNNEAQFGEFPWMVAVLYEIIQPDAGNITIYSCGGTLLTPTVVLTAAHCVQNRIANTLIARAGDWDVTTMDEILPHQNRRVREIISHENFNNGSLVNDIALLILDSAFEYEENIRPVCLPPSNTKFELARCYSMGWGKDQFGRVGKYQTVLKKIEIPLVTNDQCQENLRKTRLGKLFELNESFICAGGELNKDTCTGDGGSSLVCPIKGKKEQYYQLGIVSWGLGCGEENIPGVYTSVVHMRPWINEKLSKLKIDFNHYTA